MHLNLQNTVKAYYLGCQQRIHCNMSVCISNFSATQNFFSRSTIYVSATYNETSFYTGIPSATFAEEEPFCYYMKKVLCISACKIFGVIRMIWIFTLPGPSLILTCSVLQRERQTNLGIFGTSDCFSLWFLWMCWLFYCQTSHSKYLQNNNDKEAIIKFQLFFVCVLFWFWKESWNKKMSLWKSLGCRS